MSRLLVFISILLVSGVRVAAQEFVPPPPPPIDEYEELDDEGFESDEAFRPPPPPVPPFPGQSPNGGMPGGAAPPPQQPPPDYSALSQPGKFRFRVVDGEYWEKGKKRSRGRQVYGRSSN